MVRNRAELCSFWWSKVGTEFPFFKSSICNFCVFVFSYFATYFGNLLCDFSQLTFFPNLLFGNLLCRFCQLSFGPPAVCPTYFWQSKLPKVSSESKFLPPGANLVLGGGSFPGCFFKLTFWQLTLAEFPRGGGVGGQGGMGGGGWGGGWGETPCPKAPKYFKKIKKRTQIFL